MIGKVGFFLYGRTNSNETSEIPIGPFTSSIISEFLLAKIDVDLSELGFKFKRYVDDYEILL